MRGANEIVQAAFNSIEISSMRPGAQLDQHKRSDHGLLTEAFGITIDAAIGKSGSTTQNENRKSSWGVAEFASGFVKAVPLFMGPGRGTLLSSALYGLDEVHSGDDRSTQLTDFALGGVKGAASKLVLDKFGSSEIPMVGKGLAIGGGSSFIESAFTRTNWIDQKTGDADIKGGLQKTALQTAFGSAVGMAAFPIGNALGSKMTPSVQRLMGASLDSNMVATITTSGAFGFTSSVVGESVSQIYSGSFDPLAIAKRGLIEGLSTSAAGGAGHKFSAQYEFVHNDIETSRTGTNIHSSNRLHTSAHEPKPDQSYNFLDENGVTSEAAIAARPGNEIFPPRESIESKPIPGSYTDYGLWLAKHSLEGYTDAQVKEATAHLADHYALGKPPVMADFLDRLKPVLDEWQNNNVDILQKVSAEEKSLDLITERLGPYNVTTRRVIDRLDNKIPDFLVNELRDAPSKLRDFLLSPGATMLGISRARAKAEIVNDLIEARNQFAEDRSQTSALMEPRIRQIQNVADQFTKQHGLPPVEIVGAGDTGPVGSYGNGRISLQRQYFTGTDNTNLAGTLYHELLHHEQYTLMVRRLADRADIGRAPTRSDRELLKDFYDIWLNKALPDKYMHQILAARNGVRLTDEQGAVADTLLETTQRENKKDRAAYVDAGNSFRKINSLLTKLESEDGENVSAKIVQDAADNSNLLSSINPLFLAVRPPEVSASESSPEQTRSNIIAGLKDWQTDINIWRQDDYTAYRGRKLEWDAWLLTSLMHNAMNEKSAAMNAKSVALDTNPGI